MIAKLKFYKVWLALCGSLAVTSCSSPPEMPREVTVPPVLIPTAPAAPNISPVETATRALGREVDAARIEVRRASDKVAESGRQVSRLQTLSETAIREAGESSQAALAEIRSSATETAEKLGEAALLLDLVSDKLVNANDRAEALTGEVSTLREDLAVQSSRVDEFRELAAAANVNLEAANTQRDTFRTALTSATALVEVEQAEVKRVKKQRFFLIITSSVLGLALAGAGYLLFKI